MGKSSEAHPGGFSGGHGAAAFAAFLDFPYDQADVRCIGRAGISSG